MVTYGPLKPTGYLPRLMDGVLFERLRAFGAVEVCGTRWSGKSWTTRAFAESVTRLDENAELYNADPALALIGGRPHAIDEWQDVPAVWNLVRHAVDDAANHPGQFILTGSSSPRIVPSRHSGAGRISRVRMRTMTLGEMGLASGGVSLSGLFEGGFQPVESRLGVADYAELVCHGGWPALVDAPVQTAQQTVSEYLDLLFDVTMKAQGRSSDTSRNVAVSLARNLGAAATLKTIAADVGRGDGSPSTQTVAGYLEDLKANYLFDELPGWDAPVRAKSRVRSKPKRYFDDPSMAAALLGVSPQRLLDDGQLMELLFENLCIHDLLVLATLLPGVESVPLRYYGDSDGLEVDVVIERRDGSWGALEIKLGENKVEEAADSLNRLEAKVLANPAARGAVPSFKAVLVGKGSFAYRRPLDGVYVVPLDTLAP